MTVSGYGFYDMTVAKNDPNRIFEYGYKYEDGTLVSATINEQDANKHIFDNFNAFDKDGNGALTQTEISQQLDTLGIENTVTHSSADGWSENRKPVDKIISYNHHEQIYEKYIAPADLDKNGEVTAQELQDKYGFTSPPEVHVETDTLTAQQNPQSDNPSDNPGGQTAGKITDPSELSEQLKLAAEELQKKLLVNGIVNMIDDTGINTNGDWFIDKNEGLAAGYTQEQWDSTYKNVDLDGNNKLSVGEWLMNTNEGKDIDIKEFAKNYGENTTDTLTKYDLNNDGTVTQDEIKSYDKQMEKSNDNIIDKFNNLSTEAKVGIIVAGVVVVALIIALIVALATRKKKKTHKLNIQQQISAGQPGMMPQAYMVPMQPQMYYYMPQPYMMTQANYGYNYQKIGYNASNNLNSINQSQWRQTYLR